MLTLTDAELGYILVALRYTQEHEKKLTPLNVTHMDKLYAKLRANNKKQSLVVDSCGCEALMLKDGAKIERCLLHEHGHTFVMLLARILDASDDTLEDALLTAQDTLCDILDITAPEDKTKETDADDAKVGYAAHVKALLTGETTEDE